MADEPGDDASYALGIGELAAFGAVVQCFARVELLMQAMMAALTGADLDAVMLMTSSLSYSARRDALLSLVDGVDMAEARRDGLKARLGRIQRDGKLRNWIAHSTWKPGTRPGSIKPFQVQSRGGKMTALGFDEAERDWTTAELIEIADDLGRAYNELAEYLHSEGFMDAMLEKIDESNSATPSSPG
jgi:hypothetical protein